MVDGRPSGANPVSLEIGPEPIPSKINAKNGNFYFFFLATEFAGSSDKDRLPESRREPEPSPSDHGSSLFLVSTSRLPLALSLSTWRRISSGPPPLPAPPHPPNAPPMCRPAPTRP